MNKSDSINELAAALSKAQSLIAGAEKNAINPHFKSKFANLEGVWDSLRKPLSDNGLSVVQTMTTGPNGIEVVTTLLHSSGQWISGNLPIMASKQDPQGIGSAITYSRRYALSAIAGTYQIDDDAEGSTERAPQPSIPKQPVVNHAKPRVQASGSDKDNSLKSDPGDFIITFGQWKDRPFHSFTGDEAQKLDGYIKYLNKPGKKNQDTLDLIKQGNAYLDSIDLEKNPQLKAKFKSETPKPKFDPTSAFIDEAPMPNPEDF